MAVLSDGFYQLKPKGVRRRRDQVAAVRVEGAGFFSGLFSRRGFGWKQKGWGSWCGGSVLCFSVVVIPGDTFCSRVRHAVFLEGQAASSRVTVSNNRSVMPLDVLGRTRATLKESACFTLPVRKDRV
ncbi:Uncharacterized protein APZ42_004030, partial [Daphnia magna]